MSVIKAVLAGVIISAAMATATFAQAQEPAAFQSMYPNRDVLNGGALTPEGRSELEQRSVTNSPGAANAGGTASSAFATYGVRPSSCARRYRSYDPGSGTFLGRDGRRHSCE